MNDGKKAIGIIPARSGSKGLPGKNIKELCGKPLIAWTIESALNSDKLDEVVVSTDSREIADISKQFGASVPFLRPAELASDTATSIDVVKHVLDFYRNTNETEFDYMALLEPTSPLREQDDIDNMLEILSEKSDLFDAIISIGEIGEHPSIVKKLVGDRLVPFCDELELTSRRQDNDPAYFPYGVAYIAKTKELVEQGTFYLERATGYKIKRYQNFEIDDIYDFLCVENIMRHEWGLT
jgi:CMP-N-acetylneuraminic acid synthetase